MKKTTSGFTIVELLIVIVIIAILAAITIVAYNGVQQRAENDKTIQGVAQAIRLLKGYKALNDDYPTTPGASYACIGLGYGTLGCMTNTDGVTPAGVDSPGFDTALQTIGTLPQLSTKVLTASNGQNVAGANFEYGSKMIRYHLNGAGQTCSAGGTGFTYGNVTQCRITLE